MNALPVTVGNAGWLMAFLLAPAWLLVARARKRDRARFLHRSGFERKAPGDGSGTALVASSFLLLGLAGIGLSSPRGVIPVRDVVLVVDASRSMAAEDAVPDRMEVARASARALVATLAERPGTRGGLVAFAGRAVVRCPLTENLGAVSEALERLHAGDVRPGGSDLGAALDVAGELLAAGSADPGGVVVLLSDGEDHAQAWTEAAARLAARGVSVYTAAVGSASGAAPIPTGRLEPDGSPAVLHFRGEPVQTRRDDASLRAIAEATRGAFLPVGRSPARLGELYQSQVEPRQAGRRTAETLPNRAEVAPWAAGAALAVLAVVPLAGASRLSLTAWLLVSLIALVGPGASAPADRHDPALAAFRAGRFDEALARYEAIASRRPAEAVPTFNVAASLYALGRFEDAEQWYDRARVDAAPLLRLKIDFAVGNSRLGRGDLTGAVASYDQCLADPLPGPDADAVRDDAAVNRQFVLDLKEPPGPAGGSPSDPGGHGGEPPGGDEPGRGDPKGGATKDATSSETADDASTSAPPTDLRDDSSTFDRDMRSRWERALRDVEKARADSGGEIGREQPAETDGRDW